MYSWGCGLYHALGHGKRANRWRPHLVEALEGIGGMRKGREEGREGGRGGRGKRVRVGGKAFSEPAFVLLASHSSFFLSSFQI